MTELEQKLGAARAEVARLEAAVDAEKKGARAERGQFIYFDNAKNSCHCVRVYPDDLPADIPAANMAALCASYREVAAFIGSDVESRLAHEEGSNYGRIIDALARHGWKGGAA